MTVEEEEKETQGSTLSGSCLCMQKVDSRDCVQVVHIFFLILLKLINFNSLIL